MADQISPGGVAPAASTSTAATGSNTSAGGANNTTHEFTVPKDMVEWGATKGYKDFETKAKADPDFYKLATSYRDTEKFIGGDKIPLPKDMNDAEALRSVFSKLGTPGDPKDYKLVVPTGQDENFGNGFRTAAHANNLTQKQAEGMTGWFSGLIDGMLKTEDAQRGERAASERIDLERDWGPATKQNSEVAERARNLLSSDLGIDRNQLTDGLEETFGLRNAMRILNLIGEKAQLRNDMFEGGDHGANRGGGPQLDPAQATAEKNRLLGDREFANDYRSGKVEAKQKLAELNRIIAEGGGGAPMKISSGDTSRRRA